MTVVRWMAVLAMGAGLVGCGTVEASLGSGDASGDGHGIVDARSDRRDAKETGSRDGGSRDAKPADATARDARTGDATLKDAIAQDARWKDAVSQPDASLDARLRDAAESGADGPLPDETMISISPLALTPPFSTAIHDYYVRCVEGTNTLTVTMTAEPGSTIALMQPTTTPSSTHETATLAVAENEALVVGVTTDGGTEPYWIRCLPHTFPELRMMLHPEAGASTPGYYLVGNIIMPANQTGYAIALDTNGVPVWYHTTVNGHGAVDVDTVVPGTISYVGDLPITFSAFSGEYELHDLEAGTTTYVYPQGTPVDLHELLHLSNGDYLVFSEPVTQGVDLTGLDGFGADADILNCDLEEINPAGETVWQWVATDHFDPAQASTWPQTVTVNGVEVVDVFHCNSIDVDPNGNFLVSARHMDSVFLVSSETGAVLWKIGGSPYSKDDAGYITVENDPQTTFHRQHDARLLPEGGLSMFDDETSMPGPARGVVYSLDVDAGTATWVWQYEGKGTSLVMGSFRVLPDGSRVIGWGIGGGGSPAFTEVDVEGNDLLDFAFPDGTQSYRAIKIPVSKFDINLLRATAGETDAG
jgi:hypothetical protein